MFFGVPQVVAVLVETQHPALSWAAWLEIKSRLNSVLLHRSVNSLEHTAATWAPQPCFREQCTQIVMDHCSWKGCCYAPTRALHETMQGLLHAFIPGLIALGWFQRAIQ